MFLSFNGDRDKQTERKRGEVEKKWGTKEGNGSYWVIIQLWRWCLRPGCHLAEQTLSLCGADIGFVEGRLGKTRWSLPFMWSGLRAPGAILRKNNFTLTSHHLNLSACASKHKGAKQHLKDDQEIKRYTHTKRG